MSTRYSLENNLLQGGNVAAQLAEQKRELEHLLRKNDAAT
jgi:hypothetical protein